MYCSMLFFHPHSSLYPPKRTESQVMRPSLLFFPQSLGQNLYKDFECLLSCTKALVRGTKNLKQHWDVCQRSSRLLHTRCNSPSNKFEERVMRDVCSAMASTIYKQSPALLPLFFYLSSSSCATRKLRRPFRWGGVFLSPELQSKNWESSSCRFSEPKPSFQNTKIDEQFGDGAVRCSAPSYALRDYF